MTHNTIRKTGWNALLCEAFHSALKLQAGNTLTRELLVQTQATVLRGHPFRKELEREWTADAMLPQALALKLGFSACAYVGKVVGRQIQADGTLPRLRRKKGAIVEDQLPDENPGIAEAIASADTIMDLQNDPSIDDIVHQEEQKNIAALAFRDVARSNFELYYKHGMTGLQVWEKAARASLTDTRPLDVLPAVPLRIKPVKVSLLGYPPQPAKRIRERIVELFQDVSFDFHTPWDKERCDWRAIGEVALIANFANFSLKRAAETANKQRTQKIKVMMTASVDASVEALTSQIQRVLR